MYRIHEIKLTLDQDKNEIPRIIEKKLGLTKDITCWKIVRESIDARDKGDIRYVYTVDFALPENEKQLTAEWEKKLSQAQDKSYIYPSPGEAPMKHRPVIAGFGPCGIFAALILAELGYRPLIIERGKRLSERVADVELFWARGVLDENSNVQFGEGGAGTFSDGKLTTGTKDPRAKKVLEELASAGGGEEILYKQKPHIGTDILRHVVKNLREKIIAGGGEIYFQTRLEEIKFGDGRLSAVVIRDLKNENTQVIETDALVLAIGHSARDTVRTLHRQGVFMEQKPFSIGVRIEHPQSLIDEAQYGKQNAGRLPAADYKLAHHLKNGRGVYTFCMCPGGVVVAASSQDGMLVTNGMSNRARNGAYANSGLLVDVRTSDFESENPLAGIDFQEKYERLAFSAGGGNYQVPKTLWGDFAAKTEQALPVLKTLPEFASEGIREAMPYFARKLKGFDWEKAVIYAVESRSSSPVRIKRGEDFSSSVKGVYPGGEGAGYAGGIVSAAVDGIRIAEEIVKNYSRYEE